MSTRAWRFVFAILIAGTLATVGALFQFGIPPNEILTFGVLTVCATTAQLLRIDALNHQSYYATLIFVYAAALSLSPSLFALLVIISYCAEWAKERWRKSDTLAQWYLQPFNITTVILAGFVVYILLRLGDPERTLFSTPLATFTSIFGALVFVLFNHMLVGQAVVLARGKTWRQFAVIDVDGFFIDLVLLLMGYTVTVMWRINLLLIPVAFSPLIILYRSLKIPELKKEAQVDPKTGLWTPRQFARLFKTEFQRAGRFQRPLALLMADLDLLRNINNSYGHLAGDQVLAEVGKIIAQNIREFDVAGRFGGEEFCVALPETRLEDARVIAERLRQTVETHAFIVHTSQMPIHVTMSIGIAIHPDDANSPAGLVHAADIAVYMAKLQGRNRTIAVCQVPADIHAAHAEVIDRLASFPISYFDQQGD